MPGAKAVRKTPWIKQDPHKAYRFGTEVGRGQYGITSLVTENASGITYACKVISKHQRGFSLAYVRDEVLALQTVDDHLNIVSVHEVWETSDDVYIFMEACMGGELFDVIISRGHISESDAAVVAGVILRVVEHCHARGVIHRDLKPENFLLKRRYRKGKLVLSEDNLRAVDFGLAAFLVPGKRFRDLVGSAFYVAPEVLKGNYGKEADLWSTGVIIYILLCGLPPFHGPTEKHIFKSIQHGDIDFESDPWPHVSAPARDLVQWLLQRDPAKRPTAEEALQHAWLADPPQYRPHIPSSTIVQRLADFTRMTRLQGLLMHVVAHQLSSAEVDSLSALFDDMDTDGNGSISIEELREGLTTVIGSETDPAAADGIMAALDVSGDGEINYSEFLAAVCDHQRMLADHTLAGIFAYMDKNGDGRITADEIASALGESGLPVAGHNLEAIIAGDLPGHTCLTFNSFKQLMLGGLREDAVQYSQLESALRHMRQREQVSSRFKRLALLAIARAMPPSERAHLRRLFHKLDADASGRLSLSELRSGLHHINKQLNDQDIHELMHFMDVDASGEIDFDEFCMGILDEKALLTSARLKVAFRYFDVNDDGRIDIDELQTALKQMKLESTSSAADLLTDAAGAKAAVCPKDGVSFEEFQRMMISVDHSILPQLPAARSPAPDEPPMPQQQSCSSRTQTLSRPGSHSTIHSDTADSHADLPMPNGTTHHHTDPPDKARPPDGAAVPQQNGIVVSHAVSLSSSDTPPHSPSREQPGQLLNHCSTSEITPLHDGPQTPAVMRNSWIAKQSRGSASGSAKSSPENRSRVSQSGAAECRPASSSGVGRPAAGVDQRITQDEQRTLDVMTSIDDAWMRSFLS